MIRVAIIDDNANSRRHLVKVLGKEPDIRVVVETETGLAAIKGVEQQKPDVILMGNKDAFTDGLETTTMLVSRFEDTRVIVLSQESQRSTLTASECMVGTCLPLCQDCSSKEILAAIRNGH